MDVIDQQPYAALVAVGPGDREVERLRDLIAALGHYEPGQATLVIVDDDPVARDLDRLPAPPGLRLVAVHHRRDSQARIFSKGKGICSVVMTGLAWIQAHADVRFVVKLDTDSLVIAPFRQRILALLDRDGSIGMIGAYSRAPGGGSRDWSPHHRPIATLSRHPLLHRLLALRRRTPQRVVIPAEVNGHMHTLVHAASRHGYTPGEHCLGGGYALNATLLDRMAALGWLDTAPLWAMIDLPEDVMVGLHVRATGFGFLNNVDDGEVFGVRHIGLPFPPAELADRGYAIIHAVKNDDIGEIAIRRFFADRREGWRGN
jgi:hypothetical protein